jgi:hypothetical protein
MKNKLSPRDRLWVFADPSLKELIIKCELHLAKPITVEALRQLVQERLIQNFERFSWIISSDGHIKRANNLDLSQHVTENNQIAIDPQRPLWQFNLVNNFKIELENYQECEDLLDKLINSYEVLNMKKLLLDMKLLKLQVQWMTDANEREVLESIKELSLQIIGDEQEAVDQRIRFEQTIINCMEHLGTWSYNKELETRKKRLADLEQLVSEENS